MEILNWFGRFHPALVHLPIGILIAAAICHWIAVKRPGWKGAAIVPTLYLLGFLAASVAAFAGWRLAEEGGYQENIIFWHRWLGILLVIVSLVLWRMNSNRTTVSSPWLSLGLVLGLLWVGHLGGLMTHGEDYLVENAPQFVKKLASYEEGSRFTILDDPDSTQIYTHIIQPILQKNAGPATIMISRRRIKYGGSRGISQRGKNGKVIEGNASGSELFKRVVMDPASKKYMPPKGVGLSYGEIKLLEWWLDGGAPTEKSVASVETAPAIQAILLNRHKLDTKPKSYIEKTKVNPVDEQVMNKIREHGFAIRQIAMNNNFVDVTWKDIDTLSVNDEIGVLEEVADQIAWLDLGSSNLSDESLNVIGQMKNLVRLKMEDNPITDASINDLKELKHLESLNLYKTKITDICASDLAHLKGLKKLFIWQTEFGETGISQLKAAVPGVEVIGGYTLSTPPPSD
ncbi:MAG: hypothetical protein IPL46_09615 [Saprospiraceae bacterium]|nr:hypothetical protein [Saprospiraceae bacterium]